MGCCESALPLTPDQLKSIATETKAALDKALGLKVLVPLLVKIHNKPGEKPEHVHELVKKDNFLPQHYRAQGVAVPNDAPDYSMEALLERTATEITNILKGQLGEVLKKQLPDHVPEQLKTAIIEKGLAVAAGMALTKIVDDMIADELTKKPAAAAAPAGGPVTAAVHAAAAAAPAPAAAPAGGPITAAVQVAAVAAK